MSETVSLPGRSWAAIGLFAVGGGAWIAAFALAAVAYSSADRVAESPLLLGIPVSALGVSLTAALTTVGAALLGRQSQPADARQPVALAWTLVVLGALGWVAAHALSADKVLTLLEPSADLSCNYSLLVQCGANLQSWQGSALGVPNPLIGLAGWPIVVTVGILLLAGLRPGRWFWLAVNAGLAGALVFVAWFISQSIFVLGTLCPWCMVTWAVTIPLFWAVTLHNAAAGRFGRGAQRVLGPAYDWVPLLTVVSYIAVAILAQVRLDVLSYL